VSRSIKGINYDSSPGVDGILIRAIKYLNSAPVLAALATCMLKFNVVPLSFREARTILVYKSGDTQDPSNWRPISICSMLRRIIERVLDKKLRSYVQFSQHQRGFVNSPGCHINTSIVNAVFRRAKKMKCDVYVAFLDIVKAFDCVGFKHVRLSLESTFLPNPLREIVWSLQHSNFTRIEASGSKTQEIYLRRGIFQGAPLSPAIFNLCIDFVLKSLTEKEVCKQFGFSLNEQLDPLTALGFADDSGVFGKSRHSVVEIILMAQILFSQIGLQINPQKSSVVCVENCVLSEVDLVITNSMIIRAVRLNENIKYLGVNFRQEIVIDERLVIETLRVNVEKLIGCSMLRPDQKLNIINQYIWPTLVYPLQTAPINQLKKTFLSDIDLLIRNAVKQILGLPGDTPNAMLYSSRKVKGLEIFRASWEAFIQTYNVCVRLLTCNDPFIPFVRDLMSEMDQCLEILEIPALCLELCEENIPAFKKQSDQNRMLLQNREYENWCALPNKGKGVCLFEQCPKINQMIYNKRGLSLSEWTNGLKMIGSVAPVRVVPGRSQDGSRCRHCSEFETLAHVLGSCDHGNLLITSRHHRIRSLIADALRKKKFIVHEEVHCVADNGSNRRVDILVFDSVTLNGYIIDPTVRLETDKDQPVNVHLEKTNIYTPCIPYLLHRYQLASLEVIGLLVGARGTITTFFDDFRRKFGLPSQVLEDVALVALKGSSQILHNHLYNSS
jgi:Reverse transcriptase (RNA-dependent DNA polymerase)